MSSSEPSPSNPIPKRLTVLPWICSQTGDCCRSVSHVVMTIEEAQLLQTVVDPVKWKTLYWEGVAKQTNGHFIKLQAAPCPLLSDDGKCTVHSVRPYNCRRFTCLRPDVTVEPFEPEPLDLANGRLGCKNLSDRVATDRGAKRFVAHLQQKAQRWAVKHGWRQ